MSQSEISACVTEKQRLENKLYNVQRNFDAQIRQIDGDICRQNSQINSTKYEKQSLERSCCKNSIERAWQLESKILQSEREVKALEQNKQRLQQDHNRDVVNISMQIRQVETKILQLKREFGAQGKESTGKTHPWVQPWKDSWMKESSRKRLD